MVVFETHNILLSNSVCKQLAMLNIHFDSKKRLALSPQGKKGSQVWVPPRPFCVEFAYSCYAVYSQLPSMVQGHTHYWQCLMVYCICHTVDFTLALHVSHGTYPCEAKGYHWWCFTGDSVVKSGQCSESSHTWQH